MSRRRGNGKQVTGVEMGFICCQGIAFVLLVGILIQFVAAKLTFESGVEYLPVTITWTDSKSYTSTYMEDGKERTKTTYDNSYSYTVDGVEYNNTIKGDSYNVTPGSRATRYYNPNDPNKISEWSSAGDMMGATKHVWVFFGILQLAAIVFKIKIEQKKRLIKLDNEAYEEKIRQDIQKNREIYQTLNLAIDREKVLAILEPLRIRICKNQKKIDKIMKRANVQVGGIFFPITIAVGVIDSYRLHKLRDKLDADYAAFYMEYKRNIAEPILKQFFGEFQYKPSQGFSKSELSDFDLLHGFPLDSINSEDYIEGVYKGVSYRQADVKGKKHSNASDLFVEINRVHGRISVYQFGKKLNGDIVIKSVGSTHVKVSNMKMVKMENILFNSKFEVYTTNEQMAYYLLTPQFMEYLLRLDVRRETALRFSQNHIVFLQNGINGIFEADMSKPLDLQYEIGKSYNELKEILDFVDILNLDKVADEANLRALSPFEETMEEKTPVMEEKEPVYGAVDIEDSVFRGPAFDEMEQTQDIYESDNLDDWNKPVSQTKGSGLRLKL